MKLIFNSIFLAASVCSCFGQVQLIQQAQHVLVRINGQDFTALEFGKDVNKPYLYPLRTASGKIITRGYPVDPQPGEDTGAPHQVGIWVGHEFTSGVDYFEVDPRGYKNRPTGKIVLKDVTAAASGASEGVLAFVDDWVNPNGIAILSERRAFRFYAEPKDSRMIDVEFRLHANHEIDLADHKDGVLGLRLGKAFEERNHALVEGFTGLQGPALLNGQRSLWIDYRVTLDGEDVGVMLMDHPSNYNFPTRWRVDPRGFVFASAFAERAFYPQGAPLPPTAKDSGVKLKTGDEMVFRYRILIHPVSLDRQAAWQTVCASADVEFNGSRKWHLGDPGKPVRYLAFVFLAVSASAQVTFAVKSDTVSVQINNKPFTTLHFGRQEHKPFLHPLLTASGKPVTRGFPVDPLPGDATDHPHQRGLWTGSERVNGNMDFWENDPSYRRPHMGRIEFGDITAATSGEDRGVLSTVSTWVTEDGKKILTERCASLSMTSRRAAACLMWIWSFRL